METQQSSETKGSRINTQLLGIPKDEIIRIEVSEAEVVRRQYLSHIREPQVTIRPDGIQFNNSAIQMLEGAVYIYLMVDRNVECKTLENRIKTGEFIEVMELE